MEDLTAIQPYSGWRNSATEGEAEAIEYVASRLSELAFLHDLGMELDRQEFNVFMATELWDTRLGLTVDGQDVEVPADGLRGPRDDVYQALRFDSDGSLNDSDRNPVVVSGPVEIVRSEREIRELAPSDLAGKIVFLDYAVVDRVVQGGMNNAVGIAWELMEKEPAGLVLITSFSNVPGESHGTFVSDVGALNWVATDAAPPTLYARLEDLAPAGIESWEDLERVESAELTWDADLFSPARSGNLVARVPGRDSTRAIILGAHIDSPNSPGAMDDGSGSVILLEVARVLNEARTQPPTDLYLVWFGSEELGLYGSAHFVATHQELLDQTQAMLQTDMLSHPLDGIDAELTLVSWSYGRLGNDQLPFPAALGTAARDRGLQTVTEDLFYIYSDNSSFGGFDVPHADLIYVDEEAMEATGSVHYAAHIHDPYDTVELARKVGDVLKQMATVVLSAALDVPAAQEGQGSSTLRVSPIPNHRAVFVGSHTESVHMTPIGFTDLGMALAMEGFDVDLIPYGQAVVEEDLLDADLVVALPVVDYPSPDGDTELYDEGWSPEEIIVLEGYVADGGLLVLGNSANRLKYANRVLDPNEDWSDVNDLASRFGVSFVEGELADNEARSTSDHPLVAGLPALSLIPENGLPFNLAAVTQAQILAQAGDQAAVALVEYGDAGGQVLILADVGILGSSWGEPENLKFWQNLARYSVQ
jgi:hypothetical protein